MAITTTIKLGINRLLRLFNLRIETLNSSKIESERLGLYKHRGMFGSPVFPVLESIRVANYLPILETISKYSSRFESFQSADRNDVGYCLNNSYFSSPDAEMLYAIVREYKPQRFVEIGSGNSTRIVRQAIKDGGLNTSLISIDPHPRTDITGLSDQIIHQPVEHIDLAEITNGFNKNDILFIDSSHIVKTGSDVVFLFLNVLPALPPGALIHVHDVFLPFEYPEDWVVQHGYGFNEQYLLQALLSSGEGYTVIWPGRYLQEYMSNFDQYFPLIGNGVAKSFWLIKNSGAFESQTKK